MTKYTYSGSEEHITGNYVDPTIATYYAYPCTYCQKYFYLVNPKDFQAGGAKRTVQYRNEDTGEIAAREYRSEGV
jgi:hypothetical protein